MAGYIGNHTHPNTNMVVTAQSHLQGEVGNLTKYSKLPYLGGYSVTGILGQIHLGGMAKSGTLRQIGRRDMVVLNIRAQGLKKMTRDSHISMVILAYGARFCRRYVYFAYSRPGF